MDPTENPIITKARAIHERDGEVEIDPAAELCSVDAGTWVQAWVFVSDEDREEE